jgi:hypothetical protein
MDKKNETLDELVKRLDEAEKEFEEKYSRINLEDLTEKADKMIHSH